MGDYCSRPRIVCARPLHVGPRRTLANGHVDPHPCVKCRFEWPVRSRPPHPAEMAQGLLKSQSGGRRPAVESTLQFAELFREGIPRLHPASYVTIGSHDTFQLMARDHMRSPTSSFVFCFISMPPPGECDCSSTQSSRGTTSTGIEVTWERVKAKFPDED